MPIKRLSSRLAIATVPRSTARNGCLDQRDGSRRLFHADWAVRPVVRRTTSPSFDRVANIDFLAWFSDDEREQCPACGQEASSVPPRLPSSVFASVARPYGLGANASTPNAVCPSRQSASARHKRRIPTTAASVAHPQTYHS
jgi:hypothetical protein